MDDVAGGPNFEDMSTLVAWVVEYRNRHIRQDQHNKISDFVLRRNSLPPSCVSNRFMGGNTVFPYNHNCCFCWGSLTSHKVCLEGCDQSPLETQPDDFILESRVAWGVRTM